MFLWAPVRAKNCLILRVTAKTTVTNVWWSPGAIFEVFSTHWISFVFVSFIRTENLVLSTAVSLPARVCDILLNDRLSIIPSFLSLANSYPSIRIHGALTVPPSPSLANNLGCSHSVLDSHTVHTSYHGQRLFTFYCNTSTLVHCPVRSDSTKAGTTFCPTHCPYPPAQGGLAAGTLQRHAWVITTAAICIWIFFFFW